MRRIFRKHKKRFAVVSVAGMLLGGGLEVWDRYVAWQTAKENRAAYERESAFCESKGKVWWRGECQ